MPPEGASVRPSRAACARRPPTRKQSQNEATRALWWRRAPFLRPPRPLTRTAARFAAPSIRVEIERRLLRGVGREAEGGGERPSPQAARDHQHSPERSRPRPRAGPRPRTRRSGDPWLRLVFEFESGVNVALRVSRKKLAIDFLCGARRGFSSGGGGRRSGTRPRRAVLEYCPLYLPGSLSLYLFLNAPRGAMRSAQRGR